MTSWLDRSWDSDTAAPAPSPGQSKAKGLAALLAANANADRNHRVLYTTQDDYDSDLDASSWITQKREPEDMAKDAAKPLKSGEAPPRKPPAKGQEPAERREDSSTEEEEGADASIMASCSRAERESEASQRPQAQGRGRGREGEDSDTEGKYEAFSSNRRRGKSPLKKPSRKRPRPASPRRVKEEDYDAEMDVDSDGDEVNSELYPNLGQNPLHHGRHEECVLEQTTDAIGEVTSKVAIPLAANRYLQPYQQEGIRFMYQHFKAKEGCILGDAMGLGKTIQVLCFLLALFGKKGTNEDKREILDRRVEINRGLREGPKGRAVLIVVPASVVGQWVEEALKWGHFAVEGLGGAKEAGLNALRMADEGAVEIIIGGYDAVMGSRYGDEVLKVQWRLVIFDEFHTLKNYKAKKYKFAEKLKCKVKIGLTGTPIQNNLEELWSLLSLTCPRRVPALGDFKREIAMPIKRSRKRTADEEARQRGREKLLQLRTLVKHSILGRDKNIIRHKLKGKTEHVVFCRLSELQYKLYENILALPEFELLRRSKEPCDCGRTEGAGHKPRLRGKCCYTSPPEDRGVIWDYLHPENKECDACPRCLSLPCISKLQKAANHPYLLQVDPSRGDERMRAHVREFAELAFGPELLREVGGVERSQRFVDRVQLEPSGKLKTLLKLLQRFERQQQKVLVFSYSVQTLDLLQALAKANSLSYCRLDGTTPTGARKPIIDEFNSNPSIRIFFISTKAGGLGLNLTSASRVVIFDVAWNPSADLQAQDRAYRLGQRKDVQVYRLVSQGTIEELCYMRQIYKQQLHNLAIAKGGAATTTEEALRELKRTEGVAFDSVQGSKGEEGELFGLYNLMQLSRDSILTRLREQLALEAVDAEGATSSDLQSAVHELVQRAAKARASSQLDIEASAEQVLQALGITANDAERVAQAELAIDSGAVKEGDVRDVIDDQLAAITGPEYVVKEEEGEGRHGPKLELAPPEAKTNSEEEGGEMGGHAEGEEEEWGEGAEAPKQVECEGKQGVGGPSGGVEESKGTGETKRTGGFKIRRPKYLDDA